MTKEKTVNNVSLGPGNHDQNMEKLEHICSTYEVQHDRIDDESLRKIVIYTSVIVAYSIDNQDNLKLDFDDMNSAKFINDRGDFVRELKTNRNYLTRLDSIEKKVETFNLSDSKFNENVHLHDEECSYIEFDTADLIKGKNFVISKYGETAANLLGYVHGEANRVGIFGEEGIGAEIDKFAEKIIAESVNPEQMQKIVTRIYFLNKEFVRKSLVEKEEGTAVIRVGQVHNFNLGSTISLYGAFCKERAYVRGELKQDNRA